MTKFLLCSIAVVGLMTAPAMAADLPVKAPVRAAPLVAVYDWSGFYIGVAGGGLRAETAWSNAVFGQYSGKVSDTSGIFGGTAGINWQTGNWVFGLEGDISWTNANIAIFNCFPTCRTELDWFGTLRGRIGTTALSPRVLLYATGGAAFSGAEHIVTVTPTSTVDAGQVGWTVGGGIETSLFGNWTGKIEYLHARFGSHQSCPAGPCAVNNSADFLRVDIVRAGINYRFGGPVVARF